MILKSRRKIYGWWKVIRKMTFIAQPRFSHKQPLALEGHKNLMATASLYSSFSSAFCQSPYRLVCLEPVLGQLAARYHYLLDSGQSNLPACSCFIELDKYNMWLSHYLLQSSPIYPAGRGLRAFELPSHSVMERNPSDWSLWTAVHRVWIEISSMNLIHCGLWKNRNKLWNKN